MAVALAGIIAFVGPTQLYVAYSSVFGPATNEVLLALPLFVLMSSFLRFSGIAEALFDTLYRWAGGLRGSLAMATIGACTVIAAMTGIAATEVVVMSMIAYPQMKKYGYDDDLSLGAIAGGGTLGPLIPPSVPMIIAGLFASVSIGKLFIGGIIPGIILSSFFITYVMVRCSLRPSIAPSLPPEMRATWKEKLVGLRSLIAPIILISAVLGSIYSGAATPTEAAAVGSLGAIVCSAIARQLTRRNTLDAVTETMKITCMAMWTIIGGTALTALLNMTGTSTLINNAIIGSAMSPQFVVAMMLVTVLVMGMFVDLITIIIITLPIFAPIVTSLGIDLIWFCLLFIIAALVGYISPPFGINIFYLKGILGEEVTMEKIYRSVIPFNILMLILLAICFLFPDMVLFLPNKM